MLGEDAVQLQSAVEDPDDRFCSGDWYRPAPFSREDECQAHQGLREPPQHIFALEVVVTNIVRSVETIEHWYGPCQ